MKKVTILTTLILLALMADAQTPGRRSQVKDAHDKYANQEIKYSQEKAQSPPKTTDLSKPKKTEASVQFGRIFKKKKVTAKH